MTAKAGDRIIIESERVGQPAREGVILEVHETPEGPRYSVRWDDGRETQFRPAAGSVSIVPAASDATPTPP
jgi:hypothetical protein